MGDVAVASRLVRAPGGAAAAAGGGGGGGGAPVGGGSAPGRAVARRNVEGSFRGGDGSLYLLGVRKLLKARTQSWEEQKSALVEAGLWLDALALALNYFEHTASVVGQAPYVVEEVREEVALLLVQYASLNFAYGSSTSPGRFKLLGDICIYFCTVIEKPLILFGDLFPRFQTAGQESLFLDLLERFILSGQLTFLAPEVLEAFVERRARAAAEGEAVAAVGGGAATAEAEGGGGGRAAGVRRAERCLLLMDPHAVAVAPLTSVCKRWGMYSALAFHYTRGIGDFVSPFSVMLGAVKKFADGGAALLQDEGYCDPAALAMLVCLFLDYR